MKNSNISKIVKAIALFMLVGFPWSLWAADPAKLSLGAIEFQIGNTKYSFENAVGVLTQEAGRQSFTVGVSDPAQKAKVAITASVTSAVVAQSLSTEYDDISLMAKSPQLSIYVMPAVQLAKYNGMLYTERVGDDDRNTRFERRAPAWVNLSREQRIATGQGVIQNRVMDGTDFYLNLTPVLSNGNLIELQGVFSGVVKQPNASTGEVQQLVLQDGAFRVRIHQP